MGAKPANKQGTSIIIEALLAKMKNYVMRMFQRIGFNEFEWKNMSIKEWLLFTRLQPAHVTDFAN